ncbi:VOC family protein [Brachybacterium ginsengisoli]|uniref:VOC family protein n=1 Tax=Brachybacterium ginsengisoli TaxID=1331682 RepID=A0A291H0X4_9MICO|nr:VOC family protein [Brachybacterium ginsengisoli]ATG56111.1 VOC family protein [Brachybacterium ginsengisoli]
MFSSTPYISFPGNAREAFEYYQEVFGGSLDVMTYEGMEGLPFDPPPGVVAHAQLHGGLVVLAGADDLGEHPQPLEGSAYSLMVMPDTAEQGKALSERLAADGGSIEMPFELAPWGDHYGQSKDRFGVLWHVNTSAP